MNSLTPLRRLAALRVLRTRALLGSTGALALLLLAIAGMAAWWTPHVVDDTNLLHLQTAAETTRARLRMLDLPPDPATQMARFREWFPQGSRHVEDLRVLFRLAQREQVRLMRGDYVAGRQPETRLATYDVILPVRANYGAIRSFVAAVLNELPHASLVDLRLERANGEALDARIHLTLFYRED
jgi:hypothetical protein